MSTAPELMNPSFKFVKIYKFAIYFFRSNLSVSSISHQTLLARERKGEREAARETERERAGGRARERWVGMGERLGRGDGRDGAKGDGDSLAKKGGII